MTSGEGKRSTGPTETDPLLSRKEHQMGNLTEGDWTWERLEELLGITPSETPVFPRYDEFGEIEARLKFPLSPSYYDCIQRWGCGWVFGTFLVWALGPPREIDIRLRYSKAIEEFKKGVDEGVWDDHSVALLPHLLPFGESNKGPLRWPGFSGQPIAILKW